MTLDIKLPSKLQSTSVVRRSRVLHIVSDLQKRLQIYPGHANTLPLLEERHGNREEEAKSSSEHRGSVPT